MRTLRPVRLLSLLTLSAALAASGFAQPPPAAENIDSLMRAAIAGGLISGGVVVVGSRSGTLLEGAYGRVSPDPAAPQVSLDTIFDLASLTKVVATATSVMKLVEEGTVRLDDPAAIWLTELKGKGLDGLRVEHLLTHTSGLHDAPLPAENTLQAAVAGAAAQTLKTRPGTRFRYADINFILLGELVRRASGMTLDRFAAERIFVPLGMTDTEFNPRQAELGRIAPTLRNGGSFVAGYVQDPACQLLQGVAGHAGLFSTARDLSRFCRMILDKGDLSGLRVFSQDTLSRMIMPRSCGNGVIRGLGWDISSPYSSPRGTALSGASFGHTGFTGSSLWIDPAADRYVILLTSRVGYDRQKQLNQLRSDVATLAAGALTRGSSGSGEDR